MPNSPADILIRWNERFRKDPQAAGVVASLRERSDEIWQEAFNLMQRESPEYRNAVDEDFTRESKSHCNELLRTIVAIAAGRSNKSGTDPFEFVRTHAVWRARRQVPLTASLHAYRLAHRTYWAITREALLRHAGEKRAILSLTMLSDFWMEFFDYVGAVLAEAHSVEEALIVAESRHLHAGLMDALLNGHPPKDSEAQRLCAVCGIRPGAPMAVAVARPIQRANGNQIDFEVTLRSLGRLMEQVLPSASFGRLIAVQNCGVTAIVCSDGNTARGMLEAFGRNGFDRRSAKGLAADIGVSLDTTEISRLPQALEEARLALDFVSPTRALVHFSEIDLSEFLIQRADKAAFRLIPEWARHFTPDGELSELSSTIRTFADCNFNVKQTARHLKVHTNTVYSRLNRINKLTGIDPRTYSGTSRILTAFRLLDSQRNNEIALDDPSIAP
jgi:hypothetical protein